MKQPKQQREKQQWPFGGGEMGTLIRRMDWAQTPLGPSERWSQSLKTAVDIALAHKFPAAMAMGHTATAIYNDAYARVIGSRHPGALGQSVLDVFAEVRYLFEPLLRQVWRGETVVQERQLYPFIRNNALEDAWFTITYAPLRNETGAIVGVFSVMIEETAQVLAERRREAGEARYRSLVDLATDGIYLADRDGRFLDVNPTGCAMLGYTRQEFIGKRVEDIIRPHERSRMSELQRRMAGGERITDVGEFRRKDGDFIPLEVSMRFTPDGGWLAIGRDITERKRAEEALRASEQNLRGVANIVPDLLWTSEPDGATNWYNERWMEYTGQSLEQAIRWGWSDTIHPDDREGSVRCYREAVEHNVPLQQEQRIRRRDGAYRWFLVRAEPLRDERGRIVRMYAAATDIHEQRVAREDLEARVAAATAQLRDLSRQLLTVQEEERRRLARELHDEIGQELTGLRLRLEALSRADGAGGATALAEADALVRHLTAQVRTLSMTLRPAVLDTLGLAPALLGLIEGYQRNTGIIVDLRLQGLDRRFPAEVEITAYRVVQEALTNVARHARVDAAAVKALAEGGILMVTIRDGGRGFDADRAELVGGLGGMRERVGLVGGTLAIESAPGAGTLVAAELPLDDAATGETTPSRHESRPTNAPAPSQPRKGG